ncbi:hypothetical protein [Tsuneonella sp. HG222]
MAKMLTTTCPHCEKATSHQQSDVEGLDELIEDERADAKSEALEEQDDDYVDVSQLRSTYSGRRYLRELAAAIRSGRTDEAEYLLDRVAEEIGGNAADEVQLGRFSPQARAA